MHALPPFALERWFARWEFVARHNLCASDVEGWPMHELLALADDDARERWERLTLGYTESSGLPALREAIAATYENVSADEVLTFAGAEEGIFLAMHALLGPGDHAVVAVPAYQSLHEVARATGASVTTVPLDPRTWALDPDDVRRATTARTRVIVVNFPHSPTGALATRGEMDALLHIADERGARLFSDEVYRGLEYDESDRLPAAVDRSPTAISLGVMSKAYGLAGLRIGWIASHDDELRARLAALKDYTSICNSAPSETLALIALRARERVLARSRAIVAANLPLVDALVARHPERLDWVRPRAGTVAFPRLVDRDADGFAETLARDAGVLILPGSLFGAPAAHFRIGFGRTDTPEALERFEHHLTGSAVAGRST